MNAHDHRNDRGGGGGLPTKWILIGFLLIAGYFLITEHRAHVIQYLPFLLLAACPLLHIFHGHGGHGGHRHGGSDDARDAKISRRESTEGDSQ